MANQQQQHPSSPYSALAEPHFGSDPFTDSAASSTQLIGNSHNPNNRHSGTAPIKNHAFGTDSDSGEDEDEEGEDDPGFSVYKPASSIPKYTNLSGELPDSPGNRHQSRMISGSDPPLYPPQPHHQSTYFSTQSPRHTQYQSISPNQYAVKSPSGHMSHHDVSSRHQIIKEQDLVQIPALGPDWQKDEAKDDKDWEGKQSQSEKLKLAQARKVRKVSEGLHRSREHIGSKLRSWLRGENNFGGWFSRWFGLALLIFILIGIALLVFFLVPRTPSLFFNNQKMLVSQNRSNVRFNRLDPVSFDFASQLNLAFNAKNSYVKPKVKSLVGIIKDLSSAGSQVQIAKGGLSDGSSSLTLDTKDFTPFSLDMKFAYGAGSTSDPVWKSWYDACAHIWPGNSTARPQIQIGIIVEYSVQGLMGTKSERTVISGLDCPVELPGNAA